MQRNKQLISMTRAIAILILPLIPSIGLAETFMMNGVGTHSCGKYLEFTRGIYKDDYKIFYQQWGAGFMAGISNQANGTNPYADLETYTAWLDKWCTDDPASNVAAGVVSLGKRLSKNKK